MPRNEITSLPVSEKRSRSMSLGRER